MLFCTAHLVLNALVNDLGALFGGKLLAPCSVSIQHCSAALDWVSGGGAASAVGVSVRLVLQLARITAANSRRPKGATLVRATVQEFIANVDPKYWRQTTLAIFGVTRK